MIARFEMLRDGTFDMSNILYPRIEIEVPSKEYVKYILDMLSPVERATVVAVLVDGEYVD